MKVNEETRKVLEKEMPWISEWLRDGMQVYVRRIDLDLLSETSDPRKWFFPGSRIWLLNTEGQTIVQVGIREQPIKTFKLISRAPFIGTTTTNKRVRFHESVEKSLQRIGDSADTVRYICTYWPVVGTLYIYKIPNRETGLRSWLNHKAAEASEELYRTLHA